MFKEMGVDTGVKKDVRYSSSIIEVGVPVSQGTITKNGWEQRWSS